MLQMIQGQRKLFLFFILSILTSFVFFWNCSSSKEEQESSIGKEWKPKGMWEISPSMDSEFLNFSKKEGFVLYIQDSLQKQKLHKIINNEDGLRIFHSDSEEPVGYFLHEFRRLNSWQGVWMGQDVRLILQREPNSN